jgi:hypothetical protein
MNTIARKRYPSDLTDLQWDNIEHLFAQGEGSTGRPRTYPLRESVKTTEAGGPKGYDGGEKNRRSPAASFG